MKSIPFILVIITLHGSLVLLNHTDGCTILTEVRLFFIFLHLHIMDKLKLITSYKLKNYGIDKMLTEDYA